MQSPSSLATHGERSGGAAGAAAQGNEGRGEAARGGRRHRRRSHRSHAPRTEKLPKRKANCASSENAGLSERFVHEKENRSRARQLRAHARRCRQFKIIRRCATHNAILDSCRIPGAHARGALRASDGCGGTGAGTRERGYCFPPSAGLATGPLDE